MIDKVDIKLRWKVGSVEIETAIVDDALIVKQSVLGEKLASAEVITLDRWKMKQLLAALQLWDESNP